MKVLMLSTDQRIFDERSEVRQRMIEYGSLFEELHIVVYTGVVSKKETRLSHTVFAYPTQTRFREFYFFDAYRLSSFLIRNRHLSVITAQDPFETGLVGYLLKKKFHVPLQLQIHTDFLSPYFRSESLLNRVRVWLARYLVRRADGIRVVSERIRQSFLKKLGLPESLIVVLPIFVEPKNFFEGRAKFNLREQYPGHDFIILMVSRLTSEKNIPLALQALSASREEFSKTLLVIVGDGPERQSLQTLASKLGLGANVQFLPWTDIGNEYYRTADVFLITSNYEGYGRTAIEAIRSGVPVVMTDVGLAGEIVVNEETGLVVPVGNAAKLMDALRVLHHDPGLRKQLATAAKERLKKLLSKEQYLERYKAALNSLL